MPLNTITILAQYYSPVAASGPVISVVVAVPAGCIVPVEGGPLSASLLRPVFFMWSNPIGPVKGCSRLR
jgi:hypothetical protein